MTRLVVVVVNWNRPRLTLRCVSELRPQLEETGATLVVVDNGSDDDSVAVLSAALGDELLILPSNRGFGSAVNAAVRRVPAESYVLVNNDAVPEAGFLRALSTHVASAGPRLGALTARLVLSGTFLPSEHGDFASRDGRRYARTSGGATLLNSTGNVIDRSGNGQDRNWLDPVDTHAERRVFGFSGGGALLRAAALDDVGLFDESLFMYYEDTELSWRLARRGWHVEHEEAAVLVHDHSASSGTSSDLFVSRNAGNRLVVALWHGPWPMVLRAILRTVARVLRCGLSRDRAERHEARIVAVGALRVLGRLPEHLVRRRAHDRRATTPRSSIVTS